MDVEKFQHEILDWYKKNKRDLPWRKTRDPYKILVSEIMLQQTQVSRVIPKYEAWLSSLPTVETLSQAKKEDILRLWSGLGYNRLALYLQKCAQAIVEIGKWPETVEDLEKLPGVGPYTARAIACFAFQQQVAVVDANVRKVILLKFKKMELDNKELQIIADQLLPIGRAYDWNQALMDYSNLVLQKEKVPTKKQSSFKDSNRYYRGKLMRLLLKQNNIPLQQVGLLLKDDYSANDKQWLDRLINRLAKDGLITRDEEKIRL